MNNKTKRLLLSITLILPLQAQANGNKDISVFEIYPLQMAFLLFAFLCIVFIYFIILFHRRSREKYYKTSYQKLQHLLQIMPNMAVIYDENLIITEIINPKEDVSLLFNNDNLIGTHVSNICKLSPCFEKAGLLIMQNVKKTAATKNPCSFSYTVVTEMGTFYTESKTVSFDKNKVICFSQDVTARFTAEKEVMKLQTFLQSVVDSLPIGIFVKNASDEFRYIYYNEKAVDFYGGSVDTILGHNDYEIEEPLADQYRQEDLTVINSNEPVSFERIEYDDNKEPYRWGITTKTRLINNDGTRFIIAILVDTTEMHKKEVELLNIKDELSIALDAGSLSAWTYNINKRIFSSLYSDTISKSGMSFEAVQNIIYPEDLLKFNQLFEALLSGGSNEKKEILRVMSDGKCRWYEVHAVSLKSAKTGEIYRIIGTEKDISTDIIKKQELKDSKQKLELAFETAGMILWDYNTNEESFFIHDDSDFCRKLNSLEKYISNIHPDNQSSFREGLGQLIAGKIAVMESTVRLLSKENRYEWAQITAKATSHDKNGKALKIIGTRKFITEIVEAEQKLKAYIFKSDLAIKSSGIVQWDYDVIKQVFSSPNPESFMFHGISRATYLSYLHPEDQHLITNGIDDMIHNKISSINLQARVNIPGRGYKWVDIHGVAFEHDETGSLTKITGLRRDITESKNMTEELIVLRDKAEESNRLKSAFLANMSHEIRTPLNAIVGFSNLITQTENPDEINEYCKIIETNNELLLQLINDILDLSKIEAGQLEFVYSDFDVSSIFLTLEQIHKHKIKNEVRLISELPQAKYFIHSEKNRLTQVISNFLSNAAKFTVQGCIKMGYIPIPGGLRFYVADTGKGIDPQNQPRVFERFAKFDSFVQGTGLGLSICQTIVNRLGGEIGVESAIGQGSTFWFTIPCETTTQPDYRKPDQKEFPKTPESENKARSNTQKATILIAEDNDSNYLLLSVILKQDYHLIRAKTGTEAIRLFKTEAPDFIFMDIEMPEMNGFQATIEIRKSDPDIPVIALTAHAFDEDRERSEKAGCTGYLAKPVTPAIIAQTIRKYNKYFTHPGSE